MSVSQVIAACGGSLNRGSHLSGDACHMMSRSLARGAWCEGLRAGLGRGRRVPEETEGRASPGWGSPGEAVERPGRPRMRPSGVRAAGPRPIGDRPARSAGCGRTGADGFRPDRPRPRAREARWSPDVHPMSGPVDLGPGGMRASDGVAPLRSATAVGHCGRPLRADRERAARTAAGGVRPGTYMRSVRTAGRPLRLRAAGTRRGEDPPLGRRDRDVPVPVPRLGRVGAHEGAGHESERDPVMRGDRVCVTVAGRAVVGTGPGAQRAVGFADG